ncbi:Retrovirus-related Pol polyprotein from transposon TNT 1-94 [Eumeta japonica]|uniref:Retrovirus-related Pol polyprotein from transposon TNT 1-94 n=1 Tax=Eumeta variegata TaxID=151549 RepID=A0A4C1TEP4_EUMVA|nr:Retrovirus-related Pol polyprotein from transposon TNT 1-94 [Eumeta japonica]
MYVARYKLLRLAVPDFNPYTPQQNGLSERMNRTLVERAKCMMFNADLSKNYWAEAVTTAAYIINRSPTHALSDITPHEVWTGQKPDLSNIRIFGCPAMVHIPKEKRQKLDMKSRQLIFVGYSECTKGYRFMDPKTNKAVISRDVHFLEENIKSKIVESTSFSAPETKINNINQEVHEIQQLKDKNNNEKNNNKEQKLTQIYLPLNVQKSELITQDHENTDEKEQSSPNITDTSKLEEALQSNESEKLKQAMKDEYESLIHNNTWSLVDLPGGKKAIPCKWVFKRKFDHTGKITRYKARLVIKGYKQKKGIDYNEIYAPVIRYTLIRYLIGIAAKYNLEIHQMDAITAFLQGDVDEDIYMSQPPTFDRGEENSESYHQRSKHIDVRHHFIRERIADKQVLVKYQRSQDMTADILTKGLHRPKHETFSVAMGLRSGDNVGRNADMRSA